MNATANPPHPQQQAQKHSDPKVDQQVAALMASTDALASREAPKDIAKLADGARHAEVIAKVNELVDRVNTKRDRGPDSTRVMTDEDARRIMLGDLKDVKHTPAAQALGLSYGQVYSARKGHTFKTIYKESAKSW